MKTIIRKQNLLLFLLIISVLLSGCLGESASEGAEPVLKNRPKQADIAASDVITSSLTVLDIKKKYDSEQTNAVMPLYNVKPDETFSFSFNAPLGDLAAEEVVSVHTDIQALPQSGMDSFVSYGEQSDSKSVIQVKPLLGALVSSDTEDGFTGIWGNAPIYYLRIDYDMDASVPTKLDEPVIIPFTIKSDVAVPNLKYEISPQGVYKLVWDPVKGAAEYKVYRIMEPEYGTNGPLPGASEGYNDQFPLYVKTVKATEFDDFVGDGSGNVSGSEDGETVYAQNMFVGGDYYVTAVKGKKESNFSAAASTHELSKRLPKELDNPDDLFEFETIADLPRQVKVKFIDGTAAYRDIVYDTDRIETGEYRDYNVYYEIKGTALKGKTLVWNADESDIRELEQAQLAGDASAGYIEVHNTLSLVPDPEVPTIISEDETADSGDLIGMQKANTRRQIEEGNKQPVPDPDMLREADLNADSALEEYLVRNMIDGIKSISLKAFPEAQNAETLLDVMRKVIYQNPLILGVSNYGYEYESLTLYVEYEDSQAVIRRKQREIIKEAKSIIAKTIKPGMSEEEKRKALYDYLDDNASYDDAALDSAEENDFMTVDAKFNDSFTTYGILVNKIGVCMSYAYTYKLLSDLAGIETIVVTGAMDEVPHAWNKVQIDGEWLNVDPTNGETNAGVPYLLYNSNDETAEQLKYVTDDDYWIDSELEQLAGLTNAHDYYVVNALEVKTLPEYRDKLEEGLLSGLSIISVRLAAELDEDAIMEETSNVFYDLAPDKLETATMYELENYIIIEP